MVNVPRHCFLFALAVVCAAAGEGRAQVRPPSEPALRLARDLQADLADLLRSARALRRALDAAAPTDTPRAALAAAIDRVRADQLLLSDIAQQIADRLQRAGGTAGAARQKSASAALHSKLEALAATFDAITSASDPLDANALRAAVDALIGAVAPAVAPPDREPLSAVLSGTPLPFRSVTIGLPPVEPSPGEPVVPAYLGGARGNATPEDLAAGPDIAIDGAIAAQALTLRHDPIAIYEFVVNSIDVELYQGAMKGATETLRERGGNDVDQASLLVALMRASGLPARYVRGVVELSAAQAMSWTGVTAATRVTDALTRSGIPFRAVRRAGVVAAFQIEHTWTEVLVSYTNYRGVPIDRLGRSWVPLDPSIKAYTFTPGLDSLRAFGFTADQLLPAYLDAPQSLSPLDFFKKKISDYLAQNRPGVSFDQAHARWTRQESTPRLLPNTLPYVVTAISEETVRLSDAVRHHVRVVARGDEGVSLDVTLAASEVLGKRLTLSYVPATVDDQIAVNAFLELDNTPAYLVKLRPVLKIAGVVRAAGEAPVQMGALHDVTIEVRTPRISLPVVNTIAAGGYYAIGFSSPRTTWQPAATPTPQDTERPAADLLFGLAADYSARWSDAERTLAAFLGVVPIHPALSEVMVGSVYNRTLLFGQPEAIEWRGVFVDADLRITEAVPAGADDSVGLEFMRLAGLIGSMLESDVLEQTLGVDSVSAAKLIQLARAAGIPVEEIGRANVSAVLPTLATADIVKTHIADVVNQGFVVTIPRGDLTRHAWRGIGYIARDAATGASGYFISGGLAGGMNALAPEDWVQQQYVDTLGHPYADPPNTDPTAVHSITKVTSTDLQMNKVTDAVPLSVWIRDDEGRPVKGAIVTFTVRNFVALKNGNFGGAPQTIAQTNDLGIATVTLTLGTSTSESPFYLMANTGDTHVSQAGETTVTARVDTASGSIELADPFQAFALPGPADHLKKVFGDEAAAMAATALGTLRVVAQDQFDNPVANVTIDFVVDNPPVFPAGAAAPAGYRNLVMYPRDPPCPIQTPILGECDGQPQVSGLVASIFGAAVEAIAGDTIATTYTVRARSTGLPDASFTVKSLGSRTYGSLKYIPPSLSIKRLALVNNSGGILNAAKVGTLFERPLGAVLYVIEDNYELRPTGRPCPNPTDPCFSVVSTETARIRPVDIKMAGPDIIFPALPDPVIVPKAAESAAVKFSVLQGGGTPAIRIISTPGQTLPERPLAANPGQGQYYSWLTVGAAPALNRVQIDAVADVWVPCFDLHNGVVVPKLITLAPGTQLLNPTSCTTEPPLVSPVAQPPLDHEVFGVTATVEEKTVRVIKPAGTDTFLAEGDVQLPYTIEPADYRSDLATVNLFEIDPQSGNEGWIGVLPGTQLQGSGAVRINKGTVLNPQRAYQAELELNRGSEAQVKSDRTRLLVYADALLTASSTPISTQLDRINGTVCSTPGGLIFSVGLDAQVTIKLDGAILTSTTIPPITYNNFAAAAGRHVVEIAGPMASGAGDHPFEITAVVTLPGGASQTLTVTGAIRHDVVINASLPVGHTFVKGVDLLDGHITLTRDDLSIAGLGSGLQFVRAYGSAGANGSGPMGAGWSHNYMARMVTDSCGAITLVGGEGSGVRFSNPVPDTDPSGNPVLRYRPQAGYHGTLLQQQDGSYDYFTKERTRYHYEADPAAANQARLAYIEDTHGQKLTLTYAAQDPFMLQWVADASNRRLTFHYQDFGFPGEPRIVRVDGPLNLRLTFDYDQYGNLTSANRGEAGAGGAPATVARSETYAYSDTNPADRFNLVRFTDPNDNETSIGYYGQTDPFPGAPTGRYACANAAVCPEKYEFVKSLTPGFGTADAVTYGFTYDYSNQSVKVVTTIVAPNNVSTVYTLNPFGNVNETRILAAGGDIVTKTRWAFDDGINDVYVTSSTDANGRVTDFIYDTRGNLTHEIVDLTTGAAYAAVTDRHGNGVTSITTQSEYHPVFNKLTKRVDAEGRVTLYAIDPANGDVLSETRDPEDGTPVITTEYTYHANGRLKTMKDPLGRVSQYSYDQFGNVIGVASPGATSTSHYDERSRLLDSSDSLGHRTEYQYDALDRLTRITKRAGQQPTDASMRSADQVTEFGYLPGGEKEFVKNGLGLTTRYTYDAQNRVKSETDEGVLDADGGSHNLAATVTYDGVGNPRTEVNRRQITRRFTYDDLNRLTQTEVQDGGAWKIERVASYDNNGNKLSEHDLHGAQHTVTYGYDRLYRQVQATLPLTPARTTTKTYDRVGTVLAETDANGKPTTFTYDGVYRLRTRRDAENTTITYRYDAVGNVLEEKTSSGLLTKYLGYDALNRPARTIAELDDPLTSTQIAYETQFTYDDAQHTRDIRNARGFVVRERLNGLDSAIERTVDAGGLNLVTTSRFDGAGNVAAVKDPENGDVDEARAYDGLSRIIRRQVPLGGIERLYYDGSGNIVRRIDRAGVTLRHDYDVFDRRTADYLTESISNGGAELTQAVVHYDDLAAVVHTTDANGYKTEHHLDGLHREFRTVDPLKHVFRTEWDGVNKIAEVDQRGIRRELGYDGLNRLTAVREFDLTGTLASTQTTAYDDAHNRQTDVDRRGVQRTIQFDALRRLRRISRSHPGLQTPYGSADIMVEEREYDGNHNVVVSVDANGNRTLNGYDAADRRVALTRGTPPATTTTAYDGAGNILTIKDARAHGGAFDVRYTYDARYRRLSEENGAGGLTTLTYDQNDNLTSRTDPKRAAHVTSFTYDELNELLSVDETRGGVGGVTRYRYDANRNLIAQQDANGVLTTFVYDPLNRLSDRYQHRAPGTLGAGTIRTQSSGGDVNTALRWHFEYDGNGNETLIVDGEGQRVSKSYDHLNRLTRKSYTSHKPVFPKLTSTTFDYDASGNLLRVEEEKLVDAQTTVRETTTQNYDHLDRLTEATNADQKTVSYTYDRQGNRRSVTDPQGTATAYTYDTHNRVVTALVGGATAAVRYDYWPDSLVKKVTYPNGAVADMAYDRADRLANVTNRDGVAGSAPLSQYDYSYDANGNRFKQREQHRNLAGGAAEETTYAFDALDRLLSVKYPGGAIVQYTYAPNGNRLTEAGTHPVSQTSVSRRYSYDGLNQLTTITDAADPAKSVTFAYDANGNTVSQAMGALTPGTPPTRVTTFAYDIRDQLVVADVAGAATAFDYDYRGRRVKANSQFASIRYLYDDKAVLQEYDGRNLAPTLGYRYGANLFSLVRFGATPNDRADSFYHFDGLQSVSALTSESGQLQASYQYDAWGGIRNSFNVTPNRRTYIGEYVDPETGLHYFGARYYDDTVGRFLTQDPFAGDISVPPTLHRYAYSYNNPTTYVDRDGRLPTLFTGAVGLGVGAIGGCIIGAVKAEAGQGLAGCGKGAAIGAVVGGAAGLTLGGSLWATSGAGMGTFVASGTLAGGAGIVGSYTGATTLSFGVAGLVGTTLGEVLGVAAKDAKDVGDVAGTLTSAKFWRDNADEIDARARMGAFLGFAGGAAAGWVTEPLANSGVSSLLTDEVATVVGDVTAQGLGVATGYQDSFDLQQLMLGVGIAPLGTAASGGADLIAQARAAKRAAMTPVDRPVGAPPSGPPPPTRTSGASRASADQVSTSVASGRGTASLENTRPVNFRGNDELNATKRVDIFGPGDRLAKSAPHIQPEKGKIDVVIHGSAERVGVVIGDRVITLPPEHVAAIIKQTSGWSGEPIRLISCGTGACVKGPAQQLANALGVNVEVWAPTNTMWIPSMQIEGGGRLRLFVGEGK